MRDILPLHSLVVFHPFQRVFHVCYMPSLLSLFCLYISLDVKVSIFIVLELFHLNVPLDS